jgi:hypothetical protein
MDEWFDPLAAAERCRHIAETIEDPIRGWDAAAREAFRKRYGLDP